jgi:hypothetical protein
MGAWICWLHLPSLNNPLIWVLIKHERSDKTALMNEKLQFRFLKTVWILRFISMSRQGILKG